MTDNNNSDQLKKVAALSYARKTDAAPKLAAKGKGLVAEHIIKVAKEHNIPIHEDADLVEILETVEIDQEVPLEVYAVVAEIFSYIYKVNQERGEK